MNSFEVCLMLAVIPAGLLAAGYGLVRKLRTLSGAERLALAMLAGLCAVILSVSVMNLALPLAGIWGWWCVLPWWMPLLRETARRELAVDVVETFFSRRGAACAAVAAAFLIALLWPLFTRTGVVFYDGTSGHDAFFWIVGAEHLKRHTYLQPAVTNPVYPLYYSIESIAGLRPVWGRMAAEGLLALMSNLAGASPLKIYVAATAALFFPWIAAVYLVARTFLFRRLTGWGAVGLIALQPVFIFFHANGNLPNLLGVLAGAVVVIATARTLETRELEQTWLWLIALGGHALLCAYPEMVPTIALTCALLIGRAWCRDGVRVSLPCMRKIALGAVLALAINPVTTVRAWTGLFSSLAVGAHPEVQGSIFDSVANAARAPAMITLSTAFGHVIGATGGVLCCVMLAVAMVVVVWRARDRFGALVLLTGTLAILGYTLASGFSYGWQKAVQFSGVFVVALLPVGVLGGWDAWRAGAGRLRVIARPLIGATVVLFACATVANLHYVYQWSARKFITRDWFAAREFSRKSLHNVPVRVETQTFARPFFYTMWAAYFLDESRIYFTGERASGGYLRPSVEKYPPDWIESPRAFLVAGQPANGSEVAPVWKQGAVAIVLRESRSGTQRDGD